jgi:putative ABC transport system permease protein
MSGLLRLAWRHATHHWVRSVILVLAIALVALLPIAVHILVGKAEEQLGARAASTPVLVGARASRYDLLLNSLWFRGRLPRATTYGEVELIRDSLLNTGVDVGAPIPLLVRYTARAHPIVATTHDYYGFRRLTATTGHLPRRLGDCVVGARAADALGIEVGATLVTDRTSAHGFDLKQQVRMRVVGLLRASGSPDDDAIFTDLRTGWILEGIGHGHQDAEDLPDKVIRTRADGTAILDISVQEFDSVTQETVDQFHFHGDRSGYPVTGILVQPPRGRAAAEKAIAILGGRCRTSESAQMLIPSEVVDELLGFVFRVKAFFDANALLVAVATGLFLLLIVWLSIRVRQPELSTLHKLGCARHTTALLLGLELGLLILAGALLAAGTGWLLVHTSLSQFLG